MNPNKKYTTIGVQQICSLPVPEVLADDAYLFLWIPNMHLVRGYGAEVAVAWGFRPITTFVWLKRGLGIGNYIRNTHENAIFAVKGKPGMLNTNTMRSYYEWKRRKHSQKPPEFQDLIEENADGPYLELFARAERPGWTAWGNEVGDPFGWGFDADSWGPTSIPPSEST